MLRTCASWFVYYLLKIVSRRIRQHMTTPIIPATPTTLLSLPSLLFFYLISSPAHFSHRSSHFICLFPASFVLFPLPPLPSPPLPSPYSPSLTTLLSLNLSGHIMPMHSSPADSFEAIRSSSADESERVRTDERWRERALQENRQGSMKSQKRSCHSTTCRTCRKVMIGITSAFTGGSFNDEIGGNALWWRKEKWN